ncbi:MAG: SAP domain-containing protein [Nitrospirae bacterium]|nr:SAP domain-containing protein [Nitrospirota bacterium]
MTFAKIREIAKSKGINTLRMKKADIIKAIQTAEGNFNCFGTAVSGYCDQQGCIWIDDCLGH